MSTAALRTQAGVFWPLDLPPRETAKPAAPVFQLDTLDPRFAKHPLVSGTVRHIADALRSYNHEGRSVASYEEEFVPLMPLVAEWLSGIDPQVFAEIDLSIPQQHPLWTTVLETDKYIADSMEAFLVPAETPVTEEWAASLQRLALRRFFYGFVFGGSAAKAVTLSDDDISYLQEQLWQTAHSLAGMIYGLLTEPEPAVHDPSLFDTPTTGSVLSDEDRQWLEDAANDPVL